MIRPVAVFPLLLACALWVPAAEKYTGPRPPKPDVPYLLHADNLVETERTQAKEDKRKDEIIYRVPGASSSAQTPLAEPMFLFLSEKVPPDSLELYQMEVKDGGRQVVIPLKRGKDGPKQARLMVTRLDDKLYKLEVNENLGLENGEYSISPKESNDVFCFRVY